MNRYPLAGALDSRKELLDASVMSLVTYLTESGLTDAEFGAILGVSGETVRLWRVGKRPITPKRAVQVSETTGIPLHKLRPDLWKPPGAAARRTASNRGSASAGKVAAAE